MAGIRIGGVAVVTLISPPFSSFEGSSGDGDINVYRRSRGEPAGEAALYTDYNDGATTVDDIFNPVLSPDETTIAFAARSVSSGLAELWVVDNIPGSTATMILADATRMLNSPMWSPDSSTLVFTRANAGGTAVYGGHVESIPATGGSPTVLWTAPSGYTGYRPAYSFDGDFIAFGVVHTGADDGLWVMEDDGSNDAEIDGTFKYQFNGSQFGWANAELTLAFYDNVGGSSGDAWTIAHDGTGKTQITTGAASGSQLSVSKACWVPDDSLVILGSNQGGGFMTLFSADPAGGGETSLTASGPNTGAFWRNAFVFNNRLWFIRLVSSSSSGTIWSSALDGTDLVEELDVTDATELDWFFSGTGFEFQ